MDFPYPGFLPPEFGENGPWWFAFHQTPNLPEYLVEGKEREYISWFMKGLAYNPSAITKEDIDIFANHFSAPGTAHGAFEHFRAFSIDAEQNKEAAKNKITMPGISIRWRYIISFRWRYTWQLCVKLVTIIGYKCKWS